MDLDLSTVLPLLGVLGVGAGIVLRLLLNGHRARYREEAERRAYLREVGIRSHTVTAEEITAGTEREMAEAEERAEAAVAARLDEDPAGTAADIVNRGRR